MQKIAIVIGTRPEAIKCAPVILALQEDPRFEPVVLSTGQHRQMLDETLQAFGIAPDVDLDIMQERQTLTQVTHRSLDGLEDKLAGGDFEAVMVHGDTATTLSGALAAFHQEIPVVHIEAGLRSGRLHSPFPEEANRRLVAQIALLHLAPTPGNMANLIREGVDERKIIVTGNTVVDAIRWAANQPADFEDESLQSLADDDRKIIVTSAHRRESWPKLPGIARALAEIAKDDGVRIVLPLHRNPAVREAVLPEISDRDNITIVDPLPYLQFSQLMQRADLILSDSSGAEEEGPALEKPTLVLRDRTERPEAVAAGGARLVGREQDGIVDAVKEVLYDDTVRARMSEAPNPYGDGKATERTVAALAYTFGEGPCVVPFVPDSRVRPDDEAA